MKESLLQYYERELAFIREEAAEYAENYPEQARQLRLERHRSLDPHVERLMEAFALLAGRVHQKIADEFPEITEALLGLLYPHYLRPIPSMAIAQFALDEKQSARTTRHSIDAGSRLLSLPVRETPCQFRTCYPVTLWPVQVTAASVSPPSALPVHIVGTQTTAVIRIAVQSRGVKLAVLPIDRLRFYLHGERQDVDTLYELLFSRVWRIYANVGGPRKPELRALDPEASLQPVGFGRDEGLFPYTDRGFVGYRLLQEYFSFPEKFYFFDLCGLDGMPQEASGDTIEFQILIEDFERRERLDRLIRNVNADTFQLGCTPILNLFEKLAEPIHLSQTGTEYRVVPDVHRQRVTEVYSVDRVTSRVPRLEEEREYEPFYSFRHAWHDNPAQSFWYSTRKPSQKKGDHGSEVFLSFVNLDFKPELPPTEVVSVNVTCTNRDLAGELPVAGRWGEFQLEPGGLVQIRCLGAPTKPKRPPSKSGLQWRLVSHLGLNHLSIVEGGRDALLEMLKLYDFSEDQDPVIQKQIAGITDVRSEPHVACVAGIHGLAFCRGIRVDLEFDEGQYSGSGMYLLASVLERFFALYSAVNSFSQLVVTSRQRKGVVKQWAPRAGEQILL